MRGQIQVASEYGKGTKFFFTVLVGRANQGEVEVYQEEAAEQRASADLAGKDDAHGKTAGRILVVEDNEFNIEVVRCMLENAGHTVGTAMNGQEGLEAWARGRERGEPYEIILMDCNMPVMDGYEATRRIRTRLAEEAAAAEQTTADKLADRRAQMRLPIVALTAYAMPGDKEKCLNAGMSDYITKPVNRDGLLATVLKHLKLHWQAEAQAAGGRRPRAAQAAPQGGGGGGGGQGRRTQPARGAGRGSRAGGAAAGRHGAAPGWRAKGRTARRQGAGGARGARRAAAAAARGAASAAARGRERRSERPLSNNASERAYEPYEPFDRGAAKDNLPELPGRGGDELLSRMEEEFVAKSGALVGRMTVAAAQDNMVELSSELETLQDFSHMLRARGLTEALGSLERVIEEKPGQRTELKRTLQTVDAAAERVRSYIMQTSAEDGGGGEPSNSATPIASRRLVSTRRAPTGTRGRAAAPASSPPRTDRGGARRRRRRRGGGLAAAARWAAAAAARRRPLGGGGGGGGGPGRRRRDARRRR